MAAILLPLVCSSCMNDVDELLSSRKHYNTITFTATSADGGQTKTARNGDGSLSWLPADEINVFCGTSTSGRFISDNTSSAKVTTFTGHFEDDSQATAGASYWAVYPYSSSNSFDGQKLLIDLPSVQVSEAGSFGGGMFPSVARSNSTDLAFYNVCGGIKFSLTRDDITSVTLTSRNGEALAGQVRVSFGSDGKPAATAVKGSSEVTLRPASGGCFKKNTYYYFSLIPVTMSGGFTMTFRTNSDQEGMLEAYSPVSIQRSVFSKKDGIDSSVSVWKDASSGVDISDSGIYLGILAFNQSLNYCPIGLLDAGKLSQCKSFIDGLSMKNGTILYYAADEGLLTMQKGTYPQNLTSASLVTFTDGLDQGSLMMNPDYETDERYLTAVSARIRKGNVSGLPLSAFSIGVRGSDVSDNAKFRNNLTSLATKDENAYELTDISQLNSKFEDIATIATDAIEYTYNISLTIPGLPDGTRVRFTFDDITKASQSATYIEGTFNLKYRTLSDVVYCGLTSSSGSSIAGIVNDIFVRFDFSKVKRSDGRELSRKYLKQWQDAGNSLWQINSEFDNMTDSDISVSFKRKSVAVYLVLDCSSSLAGKFGTMQSAAKNFIQKLYDYSYVETSVKSVELSTDKISLNKGESMRLSATVYPVTAQNHSVRWSSNASGVASVDADGNVRAVASGTARITAKTVDGGYSDYCDVTVYDSQVDPGAAGSFSQSGLYLGVLAFNNGLYKYPVCRLTESSAASINAFIDGVAQKHGTVLFHAVDEAISYVKAPNYPADLSSAAIVTFTDGLDQGSMMKVSGYSDNDSYLSALNKKITGAYVKNSKLAAYSIGIRDDDVINVSKYQSDMARLASSASNSYEITDITQLEAKLNAIADVVKVTNRTVYQFSVTIPGPQNGARVRFTFDNVSNALNSSKYVEGTFNLKNRTLTDLKYQGVATEAAATIAGSVDGIFVTFTFPDIRYTDGREFSNSYVKEWLSASGSSWQINSEFDSGADSKVSTTVDSRTGVVYLVIDCSTSLGTKISTVKKNAKSFVTKLQQQSYNKYAVSSVSLNTTSVNLSVGSTVQLTPTVMPSTASNKSVSWSSSNSAVASVDANGKVTALKAGTATITVKTADGGYTAKCSVTVQVKVAGVSLNKTSLTLYEGGTQTLTATVTPSNSSNKSVSWSSSNTSVVTVDASGKVTAVKAGTATITVKTADGGYTAKCSVTVQVKVAGVSLNKASLTLYEGGTQTLTATVTPSNASNKSVSWSSSNSTVASVDANGKVTAVKAGTATITVRTADGGYTANCVTTVSKKVPAGAVDMGLSVFWATCNLGASSPEQYGGYYQWAGIQDVTSASINLNESNCPYHTGSSYSTGWTKYVPSNRSSYWSGSGSPDNKTVLDPEDDVAHVKLGGKWRMPTYAEWTELMNRDNCTWTWTTQNGVKGYKVTSEKNGNSIFLPAAGCRIYSGLGNAGSGGYYWSSSLGPDYPDNAYYFRFHSDIVYTATNLRYFGQSVRPVSE